MIICDTTKKKQNSENLLRLLKTSEYKLKTIIDPQTDEERFDWTTSHARVRFPNFTDYNFREPFGHFASYSVETRERVRCISAQFGDYFFCLSWFSYEISIFRPLSS